MKLIDFIERQKNLWADFDTIKEECLSDDETLEEWLQEELATVVRLAKNDTSRGLIALLTDALLNAGTDLSRIKEMFLYQGYEEEDYPPELLAALGKEVR